MARKPRTLSPNQRHHIVHRGICKQPIFVDDHDRWHFIEILTKAQKLHDVSVLAFCLMGNHYHLCIDDREGKLSAFQQYLGGSYTTHFNRRHARDGALLRGRFFSQHVSTDNYALNLMRYLHMNPLAAGIVAWPSAYLWSSARSYTGALWHDVVDTKPLWILLENLGVGPGQLDAWITDPNCLPMLSAKALRHLTYDVPPSHRRDASDNENFLTEQTVLAAEEIRSTVIAHYNKAESLQRGDSWRHAVSEQEPHYVAMAICKEILGLSYREIGHLFGRPEGSVGAYLRRGRRAMSERNISSLGMDVSQNGV